jgi:hypothetical protein
MLSEVSLRSKQLLDSFSNEAMKQHKEIEYLELQKKILDEEHQKLNELSHSLGERVGGTE